MLEIIARGPRREDRWRHALQDGVVYELGRRDCELCAAWDDQISRKHARLRVEGNRLHVLRLDQARNPVFVQGNAVDEFWLDAGKHFVIGRTSFSLNSDHAHATRDIPAPKWEQTFSISQLRQVRYRDAEKRIAVLSQLPDLISGARSDFELFSRLSRVLLAGVDAAQSVALVQFQSTGVGDGSVSILHWDQRVDLPGRFSPSTRLIQSALEQKQSTLHVWGLESEPAITLDPNHSWAFVVPVDGHATPGWALYIAGASTSSSEPDGIPVDHQGDIKFAELVGSVLMNIREVQRLERNETNMRAFFSPVVRHAIAGRDPADVLTPRECRISALFCDLRGFSTASERLSSELLELLKRVSSALGVTTKAILETEGVIGDFHGDAVMGFWGWPLEQEDSAERAATTALAIQRRLHQLALTDKSVRDFTMGIGIASGSAVAGQIGTDEQVKVTAFGPVVNLAARLESLTRQIQVSVLIDEATAFSLQGSATANAVALRAIARIRPYGFQTATELFELRLPQSESPARFASDFEAFERGRGLFQAGRWKEAVAALEPLVPRDGPSAFLVDFMRRNQLQADPKWDGAIQMDRK